MAEYQEQQVMVGGKTIIIYNNRKPDVFPYEDLFQAGSPTSGKYFPSVKSLVIKDDGSLWYVASRNESTFEFTLLPCNWIQTDITSVTKIISYGNDRFCLYMDPRTDPHKLVVDARLLFYGNNIVEYALYRQTKNGEQCVSLYIDAADKFHSNRIPVASVSEEYPVYKYPTNCHTTEDLTEGEVVVLRLFNNLGNLVAEVNLFVRLGIWWNDLNSHINPIVKLDATCLQMRGDDFFIYEKQDPSHLNITPYLLFADGSRLNINVDNRQCFMYGLEDFVPGYPGYSQPLIFKYFLSARETSLSHTNKDERRYLTCEKKLVVVPNENSYQVKVSVIPVWDASSASWSLRFFAYTDIRNACYDITDHVTIEDPGFDGTFRMWGHEQKVSFNYDLQYIFKTRDPMPGAQDIWITVWDKVNHYEDYTLRDSPSDDHVYGVDGSVTRKPIIWFDSDIRKYFIPTSIFPSWDAVVDSFYRLARPPFNKVNETEPPTPTHFTIRDPYSGRMLIGQPIPAAEFAQAWPTIAGTRDLVGQNVIVEFLQEVKGTLLILYGVAVDITTGDYNRPAMWPN